MNQPFLWGGLLAFAVATVIVRLLVGHPLLRSRSVRVGWVGATVAVIGGLLLVFHCAAMFFGPWINAVPLLQTPADMVRSMGVGSQIAYWVPAAAIMVAWRRTWWPALAALATAIVGVGVTMYWPYPLTVHLVWLSAIIVVGSLIPTMLLRSPRATR